MSRREAVDFVDGGGQPDASRCAAVISHARDESDLLLMNAGTNGNTIRFMPPLVVSEDEIDQAIQAVERAVTATAARSMAGG